jgi:hypothetical protein
VDANGICYQLFECKAADGTITYKKENSACPTPRPTPIIYPYYPYPNPYAYPVTGYPPTTAPTQLVIESAAPKKTALETAAPYGIAAIGAAALLFFALK